MTVTHVVGIDPGLVHTGVVSMVFMPEHRAVAIADEAVLGGDAEYVKLWIDQLGHPRAHIFIEAYRPRAHFGTDKDMVKAVNDIRAATRGTVLDNTGVKKIIRPQLMELLHVWKFSTRTHHQDLRSAARIALLGMMRDEELNRLLADVVRDHIDGNPWTIE